MRKKTVVWGFVMLCLVQTFVDAQTSVDSLADKAIGFPSRLLGKLQARTNKLNSDLTQQSTRWLEKMQRREAKLQKKMSATDSVGAQRLFAGSQQQYAALIQKLKTDTGSAVGGLKGAYMPYMDSLQGMMKYLKAPRPGAGTPSKDGRCRHGSGLYPTAQAADQPVYQPAYRPAEDVEQTAQRNQPGPVLLFATAKAIP
ncbi:hypothetical protein ACQ86N_00550 [Puia sp. P3]|uniref:hypothetical protein n=1 Tax=Puia sp. P3 TaxID=3423952 RepID=UPI003D66954C